MAELANVMSKVGETVDAALKTAEPLLFVSGFVLGATEDLTYSGNLQSVIAQRISDAVARVSGFQVQIGSYKSSQTFKVNPLGFLNKGLVVAGVAWGYKHSGLPYSKEIYELAFPLGVGYSAGGLFDDPGDASGDGMNIPAFTQAPSPLSRAQETVHNPFMNTKWS